jgi:hypothetical protein
MKHPIPSAALDDRLGFLGTSGSGKTYNAGTAVEILLNNHKARVVVIDPLGVWWGLRLLADGKKASRFNVAIFGGPHGDLPLTEHAGALIGETAATMAESCIIDLSELKSKASERRFMVAFLETIYRKATSEPFHLIVDEADLFAPQRPSDGDQVLLGHMENIVRRGRIKGFIPWLISQRPAVLNKNVLSQVDGLLAFKLTSTQDRDALDAWIEGQADKAEGKAIKDALPTLQIGQGVVWIPGRGTLEAPAKFPQKVTFDSSRTPKSGEKKKRTAALKPLDLGKLKERLGAVEAETKANDPKVLRSEVAALKAERDKLVKAKEPKAKSDPEALNKAEERGFEQAKKKLHVEMQRQVQAGVVEALTAVKNSLAPGVMLLNDAIASAKKVKPDLRSGLTFTPTLTGSPAGSDAPKRPAVATLARSPSAKPAAVASGDGTIDRPLQTIINSIRWWNVLGVAAPSHAQVAFVAGYSHKSGTWSTYLSRLRSFSLIEGRGDLALTEGGAAAAAEPETPPSGEQLRATVLAKLDTPLTRILTPILEAYPEGLSHHDAAERAGYSAQSGTWSTYLSRLRSLDLIEGRGDLKAQDWLFPNEVRFAA